VIGYAKTLDPTLHPLGGAILHDRYSVALASARSGARSRHRRTALAMTDLVRRMEFYAEMLKAKTFTPSALALAFFLLYRHLNGRTGRCDPSIATLAAETALTLRSVKNGARAAGKRLMAGGQQRGHHWARRTDKFLCATVRCGEARKWSRVRHQFDVRSGEGRDTSSRWKW
jgi:hypothetical protein